MTRTDVSRLEDLLPVLTELRSWPGVVERSPGTYYLRRQPFLHFHAGPAGRRADIRRPDDWLQYDLPEPSTAATRRRFLAVLRDVYGQR